MTQRAEVVIGDVVDERRRQNTKWGVQHHSNGTGYPGTAADARDAQARCDAAFRDGIGTWRHILTEEIAEAYAETDRAALRAELIQVAAVAVAWIEDLDSRDQP